MVADVYIALGRRLSRLRALRGSSLADLAAALATTPDRIAGFEASAAAMSVAELVDVAAALQVSVSALVSDLEPTNVVRFPSPPTVAEGHGLIAAFLKIRDPAARASLLEMAVCLAR